MDSPFTDFSDFKRRYPIRPNDPAMLLGSGSYGKVVRVEDQLETEWVAIKISEVKGAEARSLREEVQLAQRIPRQANIARYDACFRFETDTSLCDFALMKYYPDGNLAQLLGHQRPSQGQIYDLTRGILLGLQHLHQHRIVHRDFKPANILISRDNGGKLIPKIADFGLSKLVDDQEIDNSDFDLSDGRGTPAYKAPEQIEGSRVSFNLDLWAFGVVLYEIMVGQKPFQVNPAGGSEQAVRRAIELKIMAAALPADLDLVAQPYQQIIRRCLVRDSRQRARRVGELLDLLGQDPQGTDAPVGQLRPIAQTQPGEFTDHYPANGDLPTDVFAQPDTGTSTSISVPLINLPLNVPVSTPTAVEPWAAFPVAPPRKRAVAPWWYVVPAAVLLATIALYTGYDQPKTSTLDPISTKNLPESLDLTSQLVVDLPFTDQSLRDRSEGGNHAHPVGQPGFTTDRNGVAGSALLLNGKTDYIYLPDVPSLRTDSLTVSLWINAHALKGRMTLYNKSRFRDSYGEQYSSLIKPAYNGKGLTLNTDIKQGGLCGLNGGWQTFATTSSIPIVDTWHHIAFTYRRRTARTYLDGTLISERTDLPHAHLDNCAGGELKFGAQIHDYPQFFNGAIDDIRVYRRALTSAEVKGLFEN